MTILLNYNYLTDNYNYLNHDYNYLTDDGLIIILLMTGDWLSLSSSFSLKVWVTSEIGGIVTVSLFGIPSPSYSCMYRAFHLVTSSRARINLKQIAVKISGGLVVESWQEK